MDKEYAQILARVRLDRSLELLLEAQELFAKESYKSANNRAFYAIEKAIKALLAAAGTEAQTHSGALKQFNFKYIYNGDGTFIQEDYQIAAKAERIRSASDYDDFYIASKEETQQQVLNAEYFVRKVEQYLVKD
ncbi:MAG: HEPN domain-containing protein [Eubacterium sp.]|nr:HEPN domain-containing protein [Eubacterium sp.]